MRHARSLSRAAIVAAVIIAQTAVAAPQAYASGSPPANATVFLNPNAPNGGALVFEGGAGQANSLTITVASNGNIVFDDVYPIIPGIDCALVSPTDLTKVQCQNAVNNGDIYLNDGNDFLSVSGLNGTQFNRLYLYGGTGNDFMMFTPATADGLTGTLFTFMYGEAGKDHLFDESDGLNPNTEFLFGGDGDDTLFIRNEYYSVMEGGAGADTFSGFGTVSYCGHPLPISVTLDNVANDGSPGEGDNVESSIPNVGQTDGSACYQ